MSVIDALKDAYFRAEDGYYRLLDRIGKKIPIYKIIEPIDRVVPSFALLLVIIIILIIYGAMLLAGGIPGAATTLTLLVSDEDGSAVPNAVVSLAYMPAQLALPASLETDDFGEATIPGIPLGTSVEASVSHKDFEIAGATFSMTNSPTQRETITLTAAVGMTRTIKLLDSLGQPVLEPVTLTFSCSSPYAIPPAPITAVGGTATVEMPNNCETLYVSVSSLEYDSLDMVEVDEKVKVINLSEAAREYGTIVVNLNTTAGASVDGVSVELYKYNELAANPNVGPVDFDTSYAGQVVFPDKNPDRYVLKTFDVSGRYGDETSTTINLGGGATETYSFTLRENVIGNIIIQAVDKASKAGISGAKARLLYASNDEPVSELTADSNGRATFPVTRDVDYKVTIEAENYMLGRATLRVSTTTQKVELEKCTPQTCGLLVVKVVDDAGNPIDNATVALYSGATDFLAGYSERISDINGLAKFAGVTTGNYWAYAFKEGNEGKSDTGYFRSGTSDEEIDLTVTMVIGNGTVNVNVADVYGKPIPNAIVNLYDASNGKLIGSDYADMNGTYTRDIKADKKVYAVITKRTGAERYADYITAAKPVITSGITAFNVVMEKQIVDREIEVRFLGLYKGGKVVTTPAAGDEYVAKLQVRIPEARDYEEAGMHIRTGDDEIVEKDNLYIKSINIPQTSRIRAAYFDSTGALNEVDYKITNAEAKWANARWDRPLAGIYEVEATIKIRETASIGDKLNIYYRVWAKKDSVIYRSPVDQLIETYELYDNTYAETYQVNVATLCDEDFCFSATMTDIDQQLVDSVTDSYSARISNNYRLFFTLTNNSKSRIHNNANIRIRNAEKSLLFEDYAFYDADGRPTTGTLDGYEFDPLGINVGNLAPSKKISGDIKFFSQKANSSTISIVLVSDMQAVYSKTITITTSAAYEMDVIVNPTMLPSGIENDINVLVKDKLTKLEIVGAVVKVKDRRENVLATATTGLNGYAKLTLPAQKPGAELIVQVSKPAYKANDIVLKVNPEVLKITPEQIGVALNTQGKFESEEAFSARNMTAFPLKITGIKLNGFFKNILDETQIANWLEASYLDLTIQPNEKVDMALKTYLSEDGKLLAQRETLNGTLGIEASNFGQKWYFSVPVAIAIGIGAELDDPACFLITRNEWSTATEGQPVLVEFQIQNNCTVDGNPVPLRNLQARVDWTSNQLGEFSLTVQDSELLLRPGYFKKMIGLVEKETSYAAVLKFTPFGGVNGLADATITVKAINPLDSGDQELIATISAKISAVKLRECLTFSKTLLEMDEDTLPSAGAIPQTVGRTYDSFTVTTANCGGNVTLEFGSDLEVSPSDLILADNSTSGEITVSSTGEVPGQYSVFVNGKGPSEVQPKLITNIRARVLPQGCIMLNRYEFDMYDDPADDYDGYDTAEVINTCYENTITVEADTTNWRDSLNSIIMGAVGGTLGGGILAAAAGGKDGGNKPGTKQVGDSCFHDNECASGNCTGILHRKCAEKKGTAPTEGTTPPVVTTPGGVVLYNLPIPFITLLPGAAQDEDAGGAGVASFAVPTTGYFMWALLAAGAGIGAVGGAASYFLSDHKTDVQLVLPDVVIGDMNVLSALVSVIAGVTQTDPAALIDTEIGIAPIGTPLVEPKPGSAGISMQKEGVVLTNLTGFTTTKERPLVKYIYVDAERMKYDTKKTYGGGGGLFGVASSFDESGVEDEVIDSATRQPYAKVFRIEADAVQPEIGALGPPPVPLDCQAGIKVGATGTDARPRVMFAWTWGAVSEDACDVGNSNYIYCDATQFSIEVLKKIEIIQEFLRTQGSSLECPSPFDVGTVENAIGDFDIGISKVAVEKTAAGDVKVTVDIVNTNPARITTDLDIRLVDATTGSVTGCPTAIGQVEVLSKETRACTFTGLAEGVYAVEAEIDPIVDCENCADVSASNSLSTSITIGTAGVPRECEPYSTTRLGEFCTASAGATGCNDVLNAINFRANLIKDRYSSDFQKDFDDYAMLRSIFDAPPEYIGAPGVPGLGIYFRNPARFKFAPLYGEANPEGYMAQAGVYDVTIDITYEDGTWQLFDSAGIENATITVRLNKADTPRPDSPFYYLPFDGRIGESNGRVGYGINYSGDRVQVDASAEPVYTVEIPGSTPIPNGSVAVTSTDNFKKLNVTNRGTLLRVMAGSSPSIEYSPSYATPVMMHITNDTDEAWAFYGVGIDSAVVAGAAQNTGLSMSRWEGLGVNCRAYSDMLAVTEFAYTADQHGLDTSCAVVPANIAPTSYGFEFCSPVDYGNLYLESIFYTPQYRSSVMAITAANEEAELISENIIASQVSLNGVSNVPHNVYGFDSIDNIDEILDLVDEGYVCITGTDVSAEFWWNPKAIYESIAAEETAAVNNCITGT